MKPLRLPSASRWLIALAVAFICLSPAFSADGHAAGPAAPISIDISTLTGFLDTLPPDEKDEQLRDWAAYGLRKSLSPAKAGELPVRHPALDAGRHGEISPGRVVAISGKLWAIIASPALLLDKPRLGGLIDRKYQESGRLPERVSLFSYRYDATSAQLMVEAVETIELKRFFTAEYGYRSQTVGDLPQLTEFMNRIDDLVGFSWRSGRLTLAGRKYQAGNKRAVTVDDVAALYQAYNPPPVDRVALERQVRQSYDALLQSDPGLRKALRQGKTKKSQVLALLRRRLSPRETSGQVGFSLDPEYDYPALARELRILSGHPAEATSGSDVSRKAPLSGLHAEIESAAVQVERRHDLRPLLALQRRYQSSADPAGRSVAPLLKSFQRNCAYQTARYDGNLQGTGVGMILFYTDLLAKLWALDYHGSLPKGTVPGFRSMGDITVPRMDYDDFQRLSQTRLWFGLRSEGFDVYGDKLLFQPTATRVYAASSDPLYPGKESKPNVQSEAFLGWWDRHYQAVAAVEPYYYKLDQIQKWSCALMVLKEKRSHLLDFLRAYPVRRNLDFENWSRTEPVMARLNLEFLDRARLGRTTECLPLLASREYPLMGQRFVLSGGVSLASRKDIIAKLHGRGKGKSLAAVPPDADEDTSAAPPAAREISTRWRPPATRGMAKGPHLPAPTPLANSGDKVARMADEPSAVGAKVSRKKSSSRAAAGEEDGSLMERSLKDASASIAPVTVKLSWEKGPAVAVHDLVNSLAANQQKEGQRGEGIFAGVAEVRKVVRVREGAYLVKTDASRDSWIYLEVNPGSRDGFAAKASASRPDADIFCAKVVTDSYARRLSGGRTGR